MFRRLTNWFTPKRQTSINMGAVVNRAVDALPQERVSEPTYLSRFGQTALPQSFAGYPNDTRYSVIRTLRAMSQADEDVAGALRDIQTLANPGFTLEYDGGTRAVVNAEAATERLLERTFNNAGGLDGLINNQIAEVYLAGASSLEWYPTASRREVDNVAVVPGEYITIYQEVDVGYTFKQDNGTQLNNQTYVYNAHNTLGDNPYGIPVAISAISALEQKYDLLKDAKELRKLLARGAFVVMNVPKPPPSQVNANSENSQEYLTGLEQYVSNTVKLLNKGAKQGLVVALKDSNGVDGASAEVVSLSQDIAGFESLNLSNQLRVWSALATLPFMRGHMDSTTEALAKIVYPILLALAENIQLTIKHSIEYGLNLNLRLQGIPATVQLVFNEPANPFELEHEQAGDVRADKDTKLSALLGDDYREKVAQRHGVDMSEQQESEAS